MTLAEKAFKAQELKGEADDAFIELALSVIRDDPYAPLEDWPFGDFFFDNYDSSFELVGCPVGLELSIDQQNRFWMAGFQRCWLNYTNGTEQYYHVASKQV